jgi:hypothetical protein
MTTDVRIRSSFVQHYLEYAYIISTRRSRFDLATLIAFGRAEAVFNPPLHDGTLFSPRT